MLGEYMGGRGKVATCLGEADCALCDTCSRRMAEVEGMMQRQLPTVGEYVRANVSTARRGRSERTNVATRVKELVDEMRGRCVLRWWRGRRENHELRRCEYAYGLCLRCLGRTRNIRDCATINFPCGKACFCCGFPQKRGRQHIHGEIKTGKCESGSDDTVGPVCWSSWRDSQTRIQMGREFGGTWTVDEFSEWMARVETKRVRNGVLWLWEKREEC